MNRFPLFSLSEADILDAKESYANLPNPCEIDGLLAPDIWSEYQQFLRKYLDFDQALKLINAPNQSISGGFVIIDASPLVRIDPCCSANDLQKLALVLGSIVGPPKIIFERHGLCKPIKVDLSIESHRAGGIGEIPLHIDFVNTTNPPKHSMFLCVRRDPKQGGSSIISNFWKAFFGLGLEDQHRVARLMIKEGRFFDLLNVGSELNPFPIVSRNQGEKIIRFTAKILQENRPEIEFRVVSELEERMLNNSTRFILDKGQFLVTNQRLVCHGREKLGLGQNELRQDERRLLLQVFH